MVETDDRCDREIVKSEYEDPRHANYHERQFLQPYRSTVKLVEFVGQVVDLRDATYNAIDVGCGGGATIYHLSKLLRETHWCGVDWAERFFEIGRPHMLREHVACDFVKGDFYQLSRMFGEKSFDLAFSVQTLSWLPRYEEALREILHVTRRWVFVTSLFTDCNVDVTSRVYPYDGPPWKASSPYFYNTYCYERFRDFCLDSGACELVCEDFVIDVDLAEPEKGTMGTYTRRLEDGRRLQFSGPLCMNWRLVAIRMS